jgi:membrane protein
VNTLLTTQLAWLQRLKGRREPRWIAQTYLARLFARAVRDFLTDDCATRASVIAYATLLSLFPTLLVALTVLGYVIADPQVQDEFVAGVAGVFPGAGVLIQQTVASVVQHRGSTTIFATFTLLVAASGVFSSVNRYLNAIWRAPIDRGFIESSILAGFMVVAVALLYLVSLLLTTLLNLAGKLTVPFVRLDPAANPGIYPVSALALTTLTTIGLFTLMYRFIPNVTVKWSDAIRGGVVAGLLFELGKQVFGLYLISFANLDAVYGSIGAVIALLLWAFLSANILLFGGEISYAAATLTAATPSPHQVP